MRFTVLAIGVYAAIALASACSDDNDTTGAAGTTVQAPGIAGTTGSATGIAGTGAAGTGAAGSSVAGTTGAAGATQQFMAFEPCQAATDYVAGATVTVSPTTIGYAPACLKVAAGATVTIGASSFHPLSGTTDGTAGNPIPLHQMSPATVSFPTPGFYTFQCDVHFSLGMKGVIWVTP